MLVYYIEGATGTTSLTVSPFFLRLHLVAYASSMVHVALTVGGPQCCFESCEYLRGEVIVHILI